jgi:hypothetical protein
MHWWSHHCTKVLASAFMQQWDPGGDVCCCVDCAQQLYLHGASVRDTARVLCHLAIMQPRQICIPVPVWLSLPSSTRSLCCSVGDCNCQSAIRRSLGYCHRFLVSRDSYIPTHYPSWPCVALHNRLQQRTPPGSQHPLLVHQCVGPWAGSPWPCPLKTGGNLRYADPASSHATAATKHHCKCLWQLP